MSSAFDEVNWLAVGTCFLVGQIFLTLWFAALFATPWAKAYGVEDPKQHSREVPGYTYGIGAGCTLLLSVGLALLQGQLGVDTVGAAVGLGLGVALCFSLSTALPGYAFLRRWSAFFLAMGSQSALILIVSVILALWK